MRRVAVVLTLAIPSALGAQDAPVPPQSERAEPSVSRSQADHYAKDYGVTVEEAERRFGVIREASLLADTLRSTDPDTFAGTEIVHSPEFAVKVKFSKNAAEKLAALGLSKEFRAEVAEENEKVVAARQQAIARALSSSGVRYHSARRPDGTIDIMTEGADTPKVAGLLRAAGIDSRRTQSRTVERIPVKGVDKGQAAIRGGDVMYNNGVCTAGFTVYRASSPSTRYKLTAGHCEERLYGPGGILLPFVEQRTGVYTKFDVQWHSKGTFDTLTNVVRNGQNADLAITSVYPASVFQAGEYLCKYGWATYKTCGKIISTNYDFQGDGGQFVQVSAENGVNLSEGGDSGAPWFSEYWKEAWGLHVDDARYPNTNDAIFMPIRNIEELGLRVLTSP